MLDYSFEQSRLDYSLFTLEKKGIRLHILVYVDDLIITGSCSKATQEFKDYLSSCFHMKDLGPLKYFLRIGVARNDSGIYLCQIKYALDIIAETNMLTAKPTSFPLEQNHKLGLSTLPLRPDPTRYRRLIGRFIYLVVTRPDLAIAVHVLSQFMASPREDHWQTALTLVLYLKFDSGQDILLRANGNLHVTGWCDSDWGTFLLTRRSVTDYFIQLGDSPVS